MKTDENGDLHLFQDGKEIGMIFLAERAEGPDAVFLKTGRFFFVPESAAVLDQTKPNQRGFAGLLNGSSEIDGVSRSFKIIVDEGFSTEGQNSVGTSFGTLRLQQRLKHLGFPGANGQTLETTGISDDNLLHAIRLFNSAIRGTRPQVRSNTDPKMLVSEHDRQAIYQLAIRAALDTT